MDFRTQLNEQQYEAVTTNKQFVRIIAGAGSGKTRVLTYRIAFLIEEVGIDPSRILGFTFTNKAAKEMSARAANLIAEDFGSCPRLNLFTFHGFCARFLRIEANRIGFPASFTIFDSDDTKTAIKTVGEKLGYSKGDKMLKEAQQWINIKKGQGLYPRDISKDSLFTIQRKFLEIYKEYEEYKDGCYALDFNDLICKTIEILSNYPDVKNKWRSRYDCLLVDEFQDTNQQQMELINLLMNPATGLYVVGDPDQTIYTWRGADSKIIMDFDDSFADTETITLKQNYRSTQNILDSANKLISHNKKRIPKDLVSVGEKGENVKTYNGTSDKEEARWICREILRLARGSGSRCTEKYFSDIAVLYRASYLTRPLEAEFALNHIPYKIYGGTRFYERREVKDVLAYLTLLVNEKDDLAFDRIVNVPRRGIGNVTIDRIHGESSSLGLSCYEYIKSLDVHMDTTNIPKGTVGKLLRLAEVLEKTRLKLEVNDEVYSSVIKDMVKEIGYYEYIAKDEDLDEDRVGNVNALFDDMMNMLKENPDATLADYLQNVTLLTSQDDISGGNYVSLMTVHTAKGLEFNNVFVMGLNENVFPSYRSVMESSNGDGLEEERRLAYVAMTRAKKRLCLSCQSGYSYVTDTTLMPSKFFFESGNPVKSSNGFTSTEWSKFTSGSKSSTSTSKNQYNRRKTPKSTPKAPRINKIWKIGDKLNHEKFGDGVVVTVIGGGLIKVEFETSGTKVLKGDHPKITPIASAGGQA